MSIDISYFSTYEFKPEDRRTWEFITSDDELDEFFTFNGYFDVQIAAETLGLLETFNRIIPYIYSLDYYVDVRGKTELESILLPAAECLRINEETGLIQKLLAYNPEWDVYLKSVLNNWNKGRYVVVHHK
jgi:hypothetical protein